MELPVLEYQNNKSENISLYYWITCFSDFYYGKEATIWHIHLKSQMGFDDLILDKKITISEEINMKKSTYNRYYWANGPYLAKLLLDKDYKVYGLLPKAKQDFYNLDFLGIKNDIEYCVGDITDYDCILKVISEVKPDEVYNLAAQSFVGNSWELSSLTTEVNAIGLLNILNAIRVINQKLNFIKQVHQSYTRFLRKIKTETTFQPSSPYAIANSCLLDYGQFYK